MSKLEEVSSKRLVLVDNFDARMNHILMLAFSLLIGVVYTSYLWFVCSTIPGVMSALLLFGSQIAMGFPATRAYYDLGVSNRENLHFIDPSKFNGTGEHHEVETQLGEIPLIFEKMGLQIREYDKGSLDDLSDLAWFGIFVWAAYSSTSFFLGTNGYPLCLVGAMILLIACFGSYLSGYWTRRNYGFEDDLNHLQYYVEKRLRDIDTHLPKNGVRIYFQLLERWRMMVLLDFKVRIRLGEDSAVEYHMGFPSSESERIVVESGTEFLVRVYDRLTDEQAIIESGWHTSHSETHSSSTVQITNRSSDFSVNKRSSFVISPSATDGSSRVAAEVFSKVLSIAAEGRLS
ncbi:MAG: hypothetical protein ACXACG_04215 [Candidatus Thorarchaeota archaeon]|jgi:hypothetical protein